MQQIAPYIVDNGIRTRKGTIPSTSMVQNIFKHEMLYHGMYKMGDMVDYVPGQHEPILEDYRQMTREYVAEDDED